MLVKVGCEWCTSHHVRCTRNATEIILAGCKDQHLTETPYCVQHALEWGTLQRKSGFYCGHDEGPGLFCGYRIIEFREIPIQNINSRYKTMLLTAQEAL